MPARSEIIIRDPFVFPLKKGYLLTGTTRPQGAAPGIYGYVTQDLEHFEEPVCLFSPPADFWADRDFWAPEIHAYRGRYYLFASFCSPEGHRATQILASDHPLGPYQPLAAPQTPAEWLCLDGTLFIDEAGLPWMVYVHEWVQAVDGEIYAQRLSEDLRVPMGAPLLLFRASQAPWAAPIPQGGFVTDGPFLFRLPSGALGMLWSSFCESGYCQGFCCSDSGKIQGPWRQMPLPLYTQDSGHGMLFAARDGRMGLILHDENAGSASHAVLLPVRLEESRLILA